MGPSPLARGKLNRLRTDYLVHGTIPARAGETMKRRFACTCAGDHPRSRGGNGQRVFTIISHTGPSPLARGKRRGAGCGQLLAGTIPARAGETKPCCRPTCSAKDHPRSRGGNRCARVSVARTNGPSPLARGKLLRRLLGRLQLGTIPARAGETFSKDKLCGLARDHPRSRGGNSRTQAPDRK